ncbi:hypothetical protein [Geobacter sp. SVR]|uniref:hypothetical protein n=1 Tax=Geobacter sp. SVR TaxID=2495594 RepID=UPI00143F04EE|nr:hypothetical protein [Geobacter sp. SVR]BCS54099.1 hypothetical protein GSVR_24070 [Geobacter sp. SVR]GCF87582.1 hypothetical protein GSbR_41820 [Geobacter sp. SVR]
MKVIGINGAAQSGKDTFAGVAVREFGVIQLSFAAPLKDEVGRFLDANDVVWHHRNLWGTNEDKEAILRIRHNPGKPQFFKDYLAKYGGYSNGYWYFKPRTLMQYWGTEYRRAQDPDYWVKKALRQCSEDKLYLLSDMRFPNEAAGVESLGGLRIKVTRANCPGITNASHSSENALATYKGWTNQIENNGSLVSYLEIVRALLAEVTHAW